MRIFSVLTVKRCKAMSRSWCMCPNVEHVQTEVCHPPKTHEVRVDYPVCRVGINPSSHEKYPKEPCAAMNIHKTNMKVSKHHENDLLVNHTENLRGRQVKFNLFYLVLHSCHIDGFYNRTILGPCF